MHRFFKKAIAVVIAGAMSAAFASSLFGCANSSGYEPQLSSPQLSEPVIGEDGVLRAGVNTDKSPLAGMGTDKIIGIDVDVAAALADELGLSVEIVDVGADAPKAIEDDTVDIVLGIDKSESSNDLWLSSEYLPTGVTLFALEGSSTTPPTVDSAPKIAAQVSSKSAWAVANCYGADSLVSANDMSSAFNDLESGEVEYVAADAVVGMYAANRLGVKVEPIALLDSASGYCVAASKEASQLQSAIDEALKKLDSLGILDVIETKWLGSTLNLKDLPQVEAIDPLTSNLEEDTTGAGLSSNNEANQQNTTTSSTTTQG